MGQKIHPLGFRVGITKSHQSQWFARFHKHQYAQTVLEDRLLRENLLKLFPDLLNPVLKKVQKREGSVEISPKITHIKIERGLIPYEIGIQIHAGNCELIKSAIDQLKIDQNLVHNLQKTRRYLLDLKTKFKDTEIASYSQKNTNRSILISSNPSSSVSLPKESPKERETKNRYLVNNASKSGRTVSLNPMSQDRTRFSSTNNSQYNKNRRKARFTFRQSLLKNMMIVKKR